MMVYYLMDKSQKDRDTKSVNEEIEREKYERTCQKKFFDCR